MSHAELICAHCGAEFAAAEVRDGDDCPRCGLGRVHPRRPFEFGLSPLADEDDAAANASWAGMPADYDRG